MSTSRPIAKRRLYEDVVAHIETQIHEGTYAPGDELPAERNLMKELGVGRPAIREALFALQTMGLVVLNNGERARVIEPSHNVALETMRGPVQRMINQPDGLKDFQRARTFFEVGIVREAALIALPDDLRKLEDALIANRNAVGKKTLFERTDVDFHNALAQIPKNPIFLAIQDAVFDWLYEQRRITLSIADQIEAACREHEEIFNAIRDCNPDRAERAMRGHLDRGHALYWKLMQSGTKPIDI